MILKKVSLVSFFVALGLGSSFAEEAMFKQPPPERVAALLEFAGPVALTCKVASAEELARAQKRKGVPLACFSYSDPTHSSETISLAVYAAGAFYGEKRAELSDWLAKHPMKAQEGIRETGVFPLADGRSIYQFPMGFGPGGGAYCALVPCRDPRYELVLIQSTNFHDDEDGKEYSNHVSPKKDLRSVIEAVEKLVLP